MHVPLLGYAVTDGWQYKCGYFYSANIPPNSKIDNSTHTVKMDACIVKQWKWQKMWTWRNCNLQMVHTNTWPRPTKKEPFDMRKSLFFHKCSITQTHLPSYELYTVFNKLEQWLCLGHFIFSLLANLISPKFIG